MNQLSGGCCAIANWPARSFADKPPSLGRYIVDFLCVEAQLVVELDGGQHDPQVDAPRTAWLEASGFRVLRFWNSEIIENPQGVVEAILDGVKKKTLTQPSPAKAGEG